MVDHLLLSPTLSDEILKEGCAVAVGAVIGFPHGNSTIKIRTAEVALVLTDGAVEVDIVVNIGKVYSGDWSISLMNSLPFPKSHNTIQQF